MQLKNVETGKYYNIISEVQLNELIKDKTYFSLDFFEQKAEIKLFQSSLYS